MKRPLFKFYCALACLLALLAVFQLASFGTVATSARHGKEMKESSLPALVKEQRAGISFAAGNDLYSELQERFYLHVARRGHTMTSLADGRVLIIGGENKHGEVKETEVLSSSSLQITASLQTARSRHTATLLPDGRVLVIGGTNHSGVLKSTEFFDPHANAFTVGPRLHHARAGHNAIILADGKMLIAGGNADGSAELFDPITEKFSLLETKLITPRKFSGAALLKNGSVLLAGGIGYDGQALETAELFDAANLQFLPIAHWMLVSRVRPTMRVLPDGKVQIIGGDHQGTMQIYDPAEKFFRGTVPLTSGTDKAPGELLLSSPNRAAFIRNQFRHAKASSDQIGNTADDLLEWADYETAEMAGVNLAVIADGVDPESKLVQSVLRLKSSTASLTTDKILYSANESPVITGTGWEPGEVITIVRQDAASGSQVLLRAIANQQGDFTNTTLTHKNHQTGTNFILTATGKSSGYIAQTSYKDANPIKHEFTPPDKTITIKIPIELSNPNGSLETPVGLLRWRSSSRSSIASAAYSATSPNVFSGSADLPAGPCLGNSPSDCGAMDLKFLSGGIEIEGLIDATLRFDSVPEDTELAPGLVFVEGVIITGELQIEGTGTLKTTKVNVGPPLIGLDLNLGEITGRIAIGVVAGIDIVAAEPLNLKIPFGFSAGAQMSASGSSVTFEGLGTPVFNGNLSVINSGPFSARVSIGPEANISFKTGNSDSGTASIQVNGFVLASKQANSGTCNFTTSLDAGVQANANVMVAGIANGTAAKTLLDKQLSRDSAIIDNQAPVLQNCPANITVRTEPQKCSARVNFTLPTATDNCPGGVTVTSSIQSGTSFPAGTTPVVITATDTSGNKTTCTFNVIVEDKEAPTIICPPNITKETDPGLCSAVVNFDFTILSVNNCRDAVNFSFSRESGSTFPVGMTVVDVTATDQSGNSTSCSFTVTVVDKQGPTITCPTNIIQPADPGQCSAVVRFNLPNATDACGVASVVSSVPSGTSFPIGTTTVTLTATDTAGNQSSCSFNVTVTDNQAPVLPNCPANITVNTEPGKCSAVVRFNLPTAMDNCPGNIRVTSSIQSGATFSKGTTPVTITALDDSGNQSNCTFNVTVEDKEAPTIICPPNITKETDPGQCSAVVNFDLPTIAVNNCRDAISTSFSHESGSRFPVGTTIVTVTATDESGNRSACSFTVTVMDKEAPKLLSLPANITRGADAGQCSTTVNPGQMTATDNCGQVSITSARSDARPMQAPYPVGTTTITWTATDSSGNKSTHQQTVTVEDRESPQITTRPADLVRGADVRQCFAILDPGRITAADNCTQVTITGTRSDLKSLQEPYPVGTTTISWVAADTAGNKSSTHQQTITIEDREAPQLTCSANLVVETDPGQCSAVVALVRPLVSDNCSTAQMVGTRSDGLPLTATYPKGQTTISWKANDASGNTTLCQQTLLVEDREKPKLNAPAVYKEIHKLGEQAAFVNFDPVFSDNCPGATIVSTPPSGTSFPVGQTTVTSVVTDASLNKTTVSFVVTVFNIYLEDDKCAGSLSIVSTTGQYRYIQSRIDPIEITGTGTVVKNGCQLTLKDDRVSASFNFCSGTGTPSGEATIRVSEFGPLRKIISRNILKKPDCSPPQ